MRYPRFKKDIFIICIYQGISDVIVAWAMQTDQVLVFNETRTFLRNEPESEP